MASYESSSNNVSLGIFRMKTIIVNFEISLMRCMKKIIDCPLPRIQSREGIIG